jgi:hypothetical protein
VFACYARLVEKETVEKEISSAMVLYVSPFMVLQREMDLTLSKTVL